MHIVDVNILYHVYIDYTYPFGSYLMGQSNMESERNYEIIVFKLSAPKMFEVSWFDEASLEVTADQDANLRLLNLNFENSETFFNFSCFESSVDNTK